MTVIKLEVLHPNGQRELAIIEGERAVIGSASHCDLRLPVDQAAPEHLVLSVRENTLHAELKARSPQAFLDGSFFSSGTVAQGSTLEIGRTRLFVVSISDPSAARRVGSKTNSRGIIQLLALAACVLIGASLLREEDGGIPPQPSLDVALFTSPPASCAYSNPQEALAYATEQLDLANGKRERLPFVAQEGVAAAALYHTAATCFRQSDAIEQSRAAVQSAQAIEQELTDDFRARALRLSHLLQVEDYQLARRDLSVLSLMIQGKHGRMADWLKEITTQLKTKGVP
ncbi:MAG TPA: FHA domain-containing protein [Polyangiaceae bacterium]|nr:FHA domain-containing protein [Polyangiaceae bacterium]